MGSAPPESRLKELLLPPAMVGLKMGALGTTAALTVAEIRDKKIRGWRLKVLVCPLEGSRLSHPQLSPPVLPHCCQSQPLLHCGAKVSQEGQAESLLCVAHTRPGHQLGSL